MFRCQITGFVSKPGEKAFRLVVKTRNKSYFENRMNEESRQKEEVEVGQGFETVKELLVSQLGLTHWERMSEDQRDFYRS